MDYDVIIIGAGPSGLSCGIQLAKAGKKCLILEQKEVLRGKVCGDGLSSYCIQVLKKIGISEEELISWGGKKVYSNITSSYGKLEQNYYCKNEDYENYAVGLSRDVFDSQLLRLVCKAGGEVKMNWPVSKVEEKNAGYVVDDNFYANHVVMACGAIGRQKFDHSMPTDLPLGISARINGTCKLASDSFYFKYDWEYGEGYAWIFPVGDNLWNYGVWSANRRKDVKRLFQQLEQHLRDVYFLEGQYDRAPGGALIGATKTQLKNNGIPCIGDCDYNASFESGEGISFAIESGFDQANAIIYHTERKLLHVPSDGPFSGRIHKKQIK